MLDEDIIYKLGCSSINDLPPLGYLLFNLYRKKFIENYQLNTYEEALKKYSPLNLYYLDQENFSDTALENYAEVEYSNLEVLTSMADRCGMNIYMSDYYNYPKKDELSKERKEILNSFPTLDEETVNENFINNLSFIDYAWGVILNDCEYDLKRELFLSNHSQLELQCYEDYFEFPFNKFWLNERKIINGEEFVFIVLGTCGSGNADLNDLNLNYVQKKIEFQQELE